MSMQGLSQGTGGTLQDLYKMILMDNNSLILFFFPFYRHDFRYIVVQYFYIITNISFKDGYPPSTLVG